MDTIFYWLYGLATWCIIASFLVFIGFAFFGRLIWLQMRIWLLAKRGYQQIEIIGKDNVRHYFYLRPMGDKFDINDGFYMFKPDTMTKVPHLLQRMNKNLASKFPDLDEKILKNLKDKEVDMVMERYKAEKEEYMRLVEKVDMLKYKIDVVTLRWGIPTLTYYGDNPEPIDFKEPKKIYDAKVLKGVYLRILLTQRYNEFKKWIMWGVIALCVIAVVLVIYYFLFKSNATTISQCMTNLNFTNGQLVQCMNQTARLMANATITI